LPKDYFTMSILLTRQMRSYLSSLLLWHTFLGVSIAIAVLGRISKHGWW
jgi:hypothetical protein